MTKKKGDIVSKMGYRDDSPFRGSKSLNIHSPEGFIDMSNVGQPIVINDGEMILEPYSGLHQVPTDKNGVVKETPLNEFISGGRMKPKNIPVHYKDKGTPIFRDTADIPPMNIMQDGTVPGGTPPTVQEVSIETPDPVEGQSADIPAIYENLSKNTIEFYEKLSKKFNLTPGDITSAYRPPDSDVGKAGAKSRHAHGEAIDIGANNTHVYNWLLNSREGLQLLSDYNMGIIDETDPDVMAKTGATGAHFHIGTDKSYAKAAKDRLANFDKGLEEKKSYKELHEGHINKLHTLTPKHKKAVLSLPRELQVDVLDELYTKEINKVNEVQEIIDMKTKKKNAYVDKLSTELQAPQRTPRFGQGRLFKTYGGPMHNPYYAGGNMYGVGGNAFWSGLGAGALGAVGGLVDGVTFGLTDGLTDAGMEAIYGENPDEAVQVGSKIGDVAGNIGSMFLNPFGGAAGAAGTAGKVAGAAGKAGQVASTAQNVGKGAQLMQGIQKAQPYMQQLAPIMQMFNSQQYGGYLGSSGASNNNVGGLDTIPAQTIDTGVTPGDPLAMSNTTQPANAGTGAGSNFAAGAASGAASGIMNVVGAQTDDSLSDAQKAQATEDALVQTGDAVASAIPGFGQFYGLAKGASDMVSNELGETKVDPETGATSKQYDSGAEAVADSWVKPTHEHQMESIAGIVNNEAGAWGDAAFDFLLPGVGTAIKAQIDYTQGETSKYGGNLRQDGTGITVDPSATSVATPAEELRTGDYHWAIPIEDITDYADAYFEQTGMRIEPGSRVNRTQYEQFQNEGVVSGYTGPASRVPSPAPTPAPTTGGNPTLPAPVMGDRYYLHPHTGERMEEFGTFRGTEDKQFGQWMDVEAMRSKGKREATQNQINQNKELLKTMSEEQKAEMRSQGLTPSEYLGVNTMKWGAQMFGGGGNMFTNGGFGMNTMNEMPVTEFNAGGTHAENPLGGIPQGTGQNGLPNLVEEGELKLDDPRDPSGQTKFIVSAQKDMKITKDLAEKYGLPKKMVNKSVRDAADFMLRKGSRRDGDTIEENSKKQDMIGFMQAHEELTAMKKAERQAEFEKEAGKLDAKYPGMMMNMFGGNIHQIDPNMNVGDRRYLVENDKYGNPWNRSVIGVGSEGQLLRADEGGNPNLTPDYTTTQSIDTTGYSAGATSFPQRTRTSGSALMNPNFGSGTIVNTQKGNVSPMTRKEVEQEITRRAKYQPLRGSAKMYGGNIHQITPGMTLDNPWVNSGVGAFSYSPQTEGYVMNRPLTEEEAIAAGEWTPQTKSFPEGTVEEKKEYELEKYQPMEDIQNMERKQSWLNAGLQAAPALVNLGYGLFGKPDTMNLGRLDPVTLERVNADQQLREMGYDLAGTRKKLKNTARGGNYAANLQALFNKGQQARAGIHAGVNRANTQIGNQEAQMNTRIGGMNLAQEAKEQMFNKQAQANQRNILFTGIGQLAQMAKSNEADRLAADYNTMYSDRYTYDYLRPWEKSKRSKKDKTS